MNDGEQRTPGSRRGDNVASGGDEGAGNRADEGAGNQADEAASDRADEAGGDRADEAAGDDAASPPLGRAVWLTAFACALAALAAYVAMSPEGITGGNWGEDGPELAAVAATFGVSHPTGYPLYTVVGRVLIATLGFLEPARVMTLLSSLAAALAVFLVGVTGASLARGRRTMIAVTITAACVFAFARIVWSQAVITEVYALHALALAAILALALVAPATARTLCVLGYVLGLAFAHHLSTVQVVPALALVVLWRFRRVHPLTWLAAVALSCLPLTLYTVIPLRARLEPTLSWGDARTAEQVRWLITGAQYHFRLREVTPAILMGTWGRELWRALGPLPLALALAGVAALVHRVRTSGAVRAPDAAEVARDNDPTRRQPVEELRVRELEAGDRGSASSTGELDAGEAGDSESRRHSRLDALVIALALLLVLGVNAVVMSSYDIPDPAAYVIPSCLIVALLVAVGVSALIEWTGVRAIASIVLALTVAASLIVRHGNRVNLAGDTVAARYAGEAFDALPGDAVVLSRGDGRTFALWYERAVRQRYDVAVIYEFLLIWPWYVEALERRHPDIAFSDRSYQSVTAGQRIIADHVGVRPVLTTWTDATLARRYTLTPAGPLFAVTERARAPVVPKTDGARYHTLDLSAITNSDYHHDPFVPNPTSGSDHFPGLRAGPLDWRGVPFELLPDFDSSGVPPCVTTCTQPGFAAELALAPVSTRAVWLLVDGGAIGAQGGVIARASIEYLDGTSDVHEFVAFANVWDYWESNLGATIPTDHLAWSGEGNQSLTGFGVEADPTRTPQALRIQGYDVRGADGHIAGVTIFSAVQELSSD